MANGNFNGKWQFQWQMAISIANGNFNSKWQFQWQIAISMANGNFNSKWQFQWQFQWQIAISMAIYKSLNMHYFVFNEQVFATQAQEDLCYGNGVFFAIGYNSVDVFFYIKNMSDLTSVDIAF